MAIGSIQVPNLAQEQVQELVAAQVTQQQPKQTLHVSCKLHNNLN